jgi:hypothetical protein
MVELNHPKLPIGGQCHLVGTSRSWFYRWPLPENAINLELGRLIDKQFMAMPWSIRVSCPAICAYLLMRPDANGLIAWWLRSAFRRFIKSQ